MFRPTPFAGRGGNPNGVLMGIAFQGSTNAATIRKSEDLGVTWSTVTPPSGWGGWGAAIRYLNGRWVLKGGDTSVYMGSPSAICFSFWTSTDDGASWTQQVYNFMPQDSGENQQSYFAEIDWNGSHWMFSLAFSDEDTGGSSEGTRLVRAPTIDDFLAGTNTNTFNVTVSSANPILAKAQWAGSLWHATGYSVSTGTGVDSAIHRTSPDGITWTTRTPPSGVTMIRDVAFFDGLYFMITEDGLFSSASGTGSWTNRSSSIVTGESDQWFGTPGFPGSGSGSVDSDWIARIEAADLTLAVPFGDPTLYRSTNGTTWSSAGMGSGSFTPTGIISLGGGLDMALVFGSTQAATDDPTIQLTANGTSFTERKLTGTSQDSWVDMAHRPAA